MMNKLLYALIPLLVLALFVTGCGKSEEITGEVVTDLESEPIEGRACETSEDCQPEEQEYVGEPFCMGNSEYLRHKFYRCGYQTKVCESYETDKRVGKC